MATGFDRKAVALLCLIGSRRDGFDTFDARVDTPAKCVVYGFRGINGAHLNLLMDLCNVYVNLAVDAITNTIVVTMSRADDHPVRNLIVSLPTTCTIGASLLYFIYCRHEEIIHNNMLIINLAVTLLVLVGQSPPPPSPSFWRRRTRYLPPFNMDVDDGVVHTEDVYIARAEKYAQQHHHSPRRNVDDEPLGAKQPSAKSDNHTPIRCAQTVANEVRVLGAFYDILSYDLVPMQRRLVERHAFHLLSVTFSTAFPSDALLAVLAGYDLKKRARRIFQDDQAEGSRVLGLVDLISAECVRVRTDDENLAIYHRGMALAAAKIASQPPPP
jgi:hypothetical protein